MTTDESDYRDFHSREICAPPLENGSNPDSDHSFPWPSSRVCIIGVGSAASDCLRLLVPQFSSDQVLVLCIDLARQHSIQSISANHFQILLSTNQLDESILDHQDTWSTDLEHWLERFDSIYIIGFLGRPSTSSVMRHIQRIASRIPTPVYGIFSTPLSLEGSARMTLAASTIDSMQQDLDRVIVIPAQSVFESISPRPKSPAEFFPALQKRFQHFILAIDELLNNPGFIRTSLHDIEHLLSDSSCVAFPLLYSASISGESAFPDLLRNLSEDSYVKSWHAQHSVGDVYLFCHGSSELNCRHIDLLVETVDRICPDSQILVGSSDTLPSSDGQLACRVLLLANENFSNAAGDSLHSIPARQNRPSHPIHSVQGSVSHDPYRQEIQMPMPPADRVIMPFESLNRHQDLIMNADTIPAPDFSQVEPTAQIPPNTILDEQIQIQSIRPRNNLIRNKSSQFISNHQEEFNLAAVNRGRFQDTDENLYDGVDLDIPTYIRNNVSL